MYPHRYPCPFDPLDAWEKFIEQQADIAGVRYMDDAAWTLELLEQHVEQTVVPPWNPLSLMIICRRRIYPRFSEAAPMMDSARSHPCPWGANSRRLFRITRTAAVQ